MRAEVIDLMWKQVEPDLYISREQFLQSLEGWTIYPHFVDGELVGAALNNGCQFHFAMFGKKRSITMAIIRHYLQPLIDVYERVTTMTPIESVRQQRFNKVLGFKEVGRNEFFVLYELTRLRGNGEQNIS